MSLPRLLAGLRSAALSHAAHEACHGPAPGRAGQELRSAVARAGLRGRGGAAFATAAKLDAVAAERGPRTVLVNGAEGEPLSAKDRFLMTHAPHLILDGALAAAAAIDAREIVVAVRADARAARAAMTAAVAERGLGGAVHVVDVPALYLAGEETALIRVLEGGPLKPTVAPPRPSERGLRRRPTLVNNPETLAHLALVERHGADWFREVGTAAHPGSALITIAGAVRRPGVMEIACGAALEQVLAAAGGPSEPLQAVLIGGFHGTWVAAADFAGVTLDNEWMSQIGGSLGAGVVVALPGTACPVSELADTIGWLAEHSAHQCGPCSNGLPALAGLLALMGAGQAPPYARDQLRRWGGDLVGRGACRLPDGAVRFLSSGMRVFAGELAQHERHGPCVACRGRRTLVPAPIRRARR